ncbi:MAG: hypothetical protein ACRDRG_04980 [Pseudonocardiaceae bacterium]
MASTSGSEPDLLGIYLNDHLAGATGGVALARRAAGAHQGSPTGAALRRLAAEIAEDRAALLDMMAALGLPVRHYKSYAAWAAEKVGRLKLNGQIRGRSPLSSVVELEALRLVVESTAAGWRTLRDLATQDRRLDAERLDGLLARTNQQANTLEELRVGMAGEVFGSAERASRS